MHDWKDEWVGEGNKACRNDGMKWHNVWTNDRTNEWMNEGCWNVKLHMITPLVATSAIKPMGIHEKGPVIVQPHMPT